MLGLNSYDFSARWQMPDLTRFGQMDPMAEKTPDVSPYAYCAGDPVNRIDPFGTDTINISYKEGKWNYAKPIIADGNDVFNVTVDGQTSSYTFSEGEYGNRMNVLNLESNNKETFGMYQLSGTETVGFVVQPHGPATKAIDGSRLKDGSYKTIIGYGVQWPTYVGLINHNLYDGKGARVHCGTDYSWSKACLVISSSYYKKGGIHKFHLDESRAAVYNFVLYMGSVGREENVPTPGINNNPKRKIDRFEWGNQNKIGKAMINIKTR